VRGMPYQVIEGGKWYCNHCKVFSDESRSRVLDHEMLNHCLPKEYWEWDKLLTKKKR
jgi:hypothetical protein